MRPATGRNLTNKPMLKMEEAIMSEKTEIFTTELGFTPELLERHAKRTRGFGIGFIILGAAAILLPGIFTIGFEILVGVLLLFGGVLQIINALEFSRNRGRILPLTVGILAALLGVLFLANPFQGAAALTILLAALFLISGILRIIHGVQLRRLPGTGWGILNGVLGIIIAFLVWAAWPTAANWFIGILIGVDFLVLGIFLLIVSRTCRSGSEAVT